MVDFDGASKLIVALKRGASEYSIFGIEYDFGIVGGRSKLKSLIRSGTKIVSSGYSPCIMWKSSAMMRGCF